MSVGVQYVAQIGDMGRGQGRSEEGAEVFRQVVPSQDFVEVLTLPAYERIDL